MGVREFDAVCEVTAQAGRRQASPDDWEVEDPWFAQQHRPG
jgi:hypothetical protein